MDLEECVEVFTRPSGLEVCVVGKQPQARIQASEIRSAARNKAGAEQQGPYLVLFSMDPDTSAGVRRMLGASPYAVLISDNQIAVIPTEAIMRDSGRMVIEFRSEGDPRRFLG